MHKPNRFYVTLSLALVLFLLGLVAFWTWQAQHLTDQLQESLDIIVELEEDHTIDQRRELIAWLEAAHFHKPLTVPEFESKETGLAKLDGDLATDLTALGINNPLLDVVTFNVPVDYLVEDSLQKVSESVQLRPGVAGVYYQENFAKDLASNARKVTLVLLVLTAIFLLIAAMLIHNTVRLSLSANRMLIKTQELVGASWGFISRPYLLRGLWQGLLAGIIAALGLVAFAFGLDYYLPEIELMMDPLPFLAVAGGMVILGILVSFFSYFFGVRRYLRLRIDDLY